MQGNLDTPPIIVRSSRLVSAMVLLICAAFLTLAILVLRDPAKDHAQAVFAAAFSAIGIPLFVWRFVHPDRLTLSPDGITWHGVFRTRRWRWEDIQNFRPYKMRSDSLSAYVAFDSKPSDRSGPIANAAKALKHVDGTLGNGWEMSAEELSDLLNRARARWAVRQS